MDKELIEMMRECDLIAGNSEHGIFVMALKKFAGMVEAKAKTEEREACAKYVKSIDVGDSSLTIVIDAIGDAILARGKA